MFHDVSIGPFPVEDFMNAKVDKLHKSIKILNSPENRSTKFHQNPIHNYMPFLRVVEKKQLSCLAPEFSDTTPNHAKQPFKDTPNHPNHHHQHKTHTFLRPASGSCGGPVCRGEKMPRGSARTFEAGRWSGTGLGKNAS